MKYFKLLNSGIDVSSMYQEIVANEPSWYIARFKRENTVRVQQETNTIHIRTLLPHSDINVKTEDNHETTWTKLSRKFPLACQFMNDFATSINGTLSRALIVRLKPKGIVYRHIDDGAYYVIRDRYHLVIKSSHGSPLYSADEKVEMQEGELWWFDNHQHHQAENPSNDWRIHYIFDVLPERYAHLAKNPKPLNELPSWFIELPV